jgi:predicted transglutaminase-like cysteine proteinase
MIEVGYDREILVVFDKKSRDAMFENVLTMRTGRSNFIVDNMFKTSWEKTVKRLCSMPDVEFWIFPENTRVLEGVCFEQLMVEEDLAEE